MTALRCLPATPSIRINFAGEPSAASAQPLFLADRVTGQIDDRIQAEGKAAHRLDELVIRKYRVGQQGEIGASDDLETELREDSLLPVILFVHLLHPSWRCGCRRMSETTGSDMTVIVRLSLGINDPPQPTSDDVFGHQLRGEKHRIFVAKIARNKAPVCQELLEHLSGSHRLTFSPARASADRIVDRGSSSILAISAIGVPLA